MVSTGPESTYIDVFETGTGGDRRAGLRETPDDIGTAEVLQSQKRLEAKRR